VVVLTNLIECLKSQWMQGASWCPNLDAVQYASTIGENIGGEKVRGILVSGEEGLGGLRQPQRMSLQNAPSSLLPTECKLFLARRKHMVLPCDRGPQSG
jgi:hypothetical protein